MCHPQISISVRTTILIYGHHWDRPIFKLQFSVLTYISVKFYKLYKSSGKCDDKQH